jgi:hypothetical protein
LVKISSSSSGEITFSGRASLMSRIGQVTLLLGEADKFFDLFSDLGRGGRSTVELDFRFAVVIGGMGAVLGGRLALAGWARVMVWRSEMTLSGATLAPDTQTFDLRITNQKRECRLVVLWNG